MDGYLRVTFERWREVLLTCLAHNEAAIDFGNKPHTLRTIMYTPSTFTCTLYLSGDDDREEDVDTGNNCVFDDIPWLGRCSAHAHHDWVHRKDSHRSSATGVWFADRGPEPSERQ